MGHRFCVVSAQKNNTTSHSIINRLKEERNIYRLSISGNHKVDVLKNDRGLLIPCHAIKCTSISSPPTYVFIYCIYKMFRLELHWNRSDFDLFSPQATILIRSILCYSHQRREHHVYTCVYVFFLCLVLIFSLLVCELILSTIYLFTGLRDVPE